MASKAKKEIRQTKLPNGLELIGEINPGSKSAALGFFVRTGARDEQPRESGISHFLEHMMFKGTEKRSALDITYALGNIGAQANAFTSEECTAYYSAVIPQYFSACHEVLSDMLRPALDPVEFATEKNVILEEIALYLDRPQFYLFEKAMSDYFGGHPAGNSVLGSVESVSAISRDDMAAYFARRYSPSNMSLVAGGNFDWDRFVEDAAQYCGSWVPFEVSRETSPHTVPQVYKEYRKKDVAQAHALLVTGGCSAQHEDRYALSILSLILGDGTNSKLYWELVDSGLAECAWCDSDEKDGTGCFNAYAATEPAQLEQVAGIMRRIVSAPLDFSDDELERAKTKIAARVVLGGELPLARMNALGSAWLYRRELQRLDQVVEQIKSVSRRSIEEAVSRHSFGVWSEFRLIPE